MVMAACEQAVHMNIDETALLSVGYLPQKRF